jgi:hypothetical protein
MGNIDRRILYLISFIVMAAPLFMTFPLPIAKNARSLDVYNRIEALDQTDGKGLVLFCANFSPDTKGESVPQAKVLLKHLLRSGKKFAIWTFNSSSAPGQEMVNNTCKEIAADLRKEGIIREYGKDWINLGFRAAGAPIMIGISKNIPGFFKTDAYNTPLAKLPIMGRVKTAHDLGLVIDVSPSGTYAVLIAAMTGKYDVPLVLAPTSVMVPDTYPYLASGQVKGELRGVLGAAEYEDLIGEPDMGTREMTSIAALDAYIIILIIIGNIAYFRGRKAEGALR